MKSGETITAGCTVKLQGRPTPAKVVFAAQPNMQCVYTNAEGEETRATMKNELFFMIEGDNEKTYRTKDLVSQ